MLDKKVLVTGACGLIGAELCNQLHAQGYYVVGIDNEFRYSYRPQSQEFISANIEKYLSQIDSNFDYIFHMGNINGTKYFYDIPNKLIQNNIEADFAVFNYVKQNPACKLIYASSSEVVVGDDILPTPETKDFKIKDIHNPRWSYRLGKIVGENYLMNSDLNFLILRFFNIFGPRSGSGHFVRDILNKIDSNDYTLIGADETRSFCRVEDAVEAILNIFDIASQDIVNIGSDEEITIKEAANLIAGNTIDWICIDGKEGSVKRRKPDISKLLTYYPQFNPQQFKDAISDLQEQ